MNAILNEFIELYECYYDQLSTEQQEELKEDLECVVEKFLELVMDLKYK